MSTAGKVLSVLVALMVLVSVYLLSMVSQLNRNWGKGIDTVAEQIEQVDEQVRQAQAAAYALQQQVVSERQITDAKLRSLRLQVEDLENRVSFLKEDQLRLQIRLDDEQNLLARTQESIAVREQEQETLRSELSQANDRRDRFASENAEKFECLASLRERLSTLLAENEQLLRRVADRTSEPAEAVENTE